MVNHLYGMTKRLPVPIFIILCFSKYHIWINTFKRICSNG